MTNENGDTWNDMCMKRPIVKLPTIFDFFTRRKRSADFDNFSLSDEDYFDFSDDELPKISTRVEDFVTQYR